MGVLITENAEFYIKAYRNIYLYYNFDPEYTYGDGQILDLRSSNKEYPLEKFIMRYLKNGMVYFDVGANNGYYYSLQVAKRFNECKIYSFEPDPEILRHLYKNVTFGDFENIIVVPQALSCCSGKVKMTHGLGASGYLIHKSSELMNAIEVDASTLDAFIKERNIDRVDLIKVDIEGEEYNFLRGAKECIKHYKPVMILEADDTLLMRNNASVSDVISFLGNYGYRCFRVIGSRDILAMPHEKIGFISETDDNWLQKID